MIELKRVYEKPSRKDGLRVLVDRLWPRGLTKEAAAVDLWLKEAAPSTELRKWFGHDPAKWRQFQARYRRELRDNADALELLKLKGKTQTVTLLYGARDVKHNEAVVLKSLLEGDSAKGGVPQRVKSRPKASHPKSSHPAPRHAPKKAPAATASRAKRRA